MVYDFGLMKQNMKALIESFDHAITLWSGDEASYIEDMQKHSQRWVLLPVSPSAEQFSRVIFILIDTLLSLTKGINGEKEVKLHSVIVHETDTGYAQGFREDAYSEAMGKIPLTGIVFSKAIQEDWTDKNLFEKMQKGEAFINPQEV
jgi:6-pyruvoyltetrahydropterin/6-carboxytetrahydropterin synthase